MNIFQKILGTIFPPYKYPVIRREQQKWLDAVVAAMPDEFAGIKQQLNAGRMMNLSDWRLFPDFKFTGKAYAGETIFQYKKRGRNFKISGIGVFSKRTKTEEAVTLLIKNNLLCGLQISNSDYDLSRYDLGRIDASRTQVSEFYFPPDQFDLFYEQLSDEVRALLDRDRIEEIEHGNRTLYSFYDMEDGNCLAFDKKQQVYSLVHDGRPVVTRMKVSLVEILQALQNGTFDKEKHLDQRYRNGK